MKRQEENEKFTVIDEEVPVLGRGQRRGMGDTMWKYEQFRAGQVYTKFMFNTRQEAEEFSAQMAKAAPDLFSRIEPVEASAVWN